MPHLAHSPLIVVPIMAPTQSTEGGQGLRRSAHCKKAATPEPTSDNSGMISWSPTPVWSRGANPGHSDEADQHTRLATPQPQAEDEYGPTTQEVAVTLVAMKSRQGDSDDRGHKVRCKDGQ